MTGMIKDRGIIKWQGMMLTEHNVEIKTWQDKDQNIERPELDDWELEAIQMELELAYKRQCDANVTVWRNGKTDSYIGKITELDHRLQSISVEGPFGQDRIPVRDIIKVNSMY
ncbi:YolD-like family protein [Sporosarcina sp. NPDC096371]|uniref:YolD-like family protein n=1 Tax=Sporosarcina sp. NPDC096371 TaxID=3364530 RepID=UPI0037F396D0